jgi:phenylpropionate dioxygenase-like ring-hydroxylating dioxygenase large terminal subunit
MSFATPSNQKLPDYWEHPDTDTAAQLYAELQRELPAGHILYGVSVETFGWTAHGSDDILFRWLDEPNHFTIVHLSWLGRTEINAQHPTVEFDGSFAEFLAYHDQFVTFLRDVCKRRNA